MKTKKEKVVIKDKLVQVWITSAQYKLIKKRSLPFGSVADYMRFLIAKGE